MKLYMMLTGFMRTDKNNVIAMSNMATVDDPNPDFIWYDMPIMSVLIDHPTEGLILYDTGLNPDYMKEKNRMTTVFPGRMDDDMRIENLLAKIGKTPADIKTLILSHLHYDHVGQLYLFKNIKTYVPGEDADMSGLPANDTLDYVKIYEDTEIAEGIKLIKLPGHTAGIMGMQVTLENSGTLLFTSDALYSSENYAFEIPDFGTMPMPNQSIYDSLSFVKSVGKIQAIEKEYNATLVFGHDQENTTKFRFLPEYYD